MRYISLDIETGGLATSCSIVEVGAIIDDLSKPWNPEAPTFHAFLLHDQIIGEPEGLRMNARCIERIAARRGEEGFDGTTRYIKPEHFARDFEGWLALQGFGHGNIPTLAGKNVAFDRARLELLPRVSGRILFRHRTLDPTSLFLDPNADRVPPSLGLCLERSGQGGVVAHSAIDDAMDVIRCLRFSYHGERVA